MHVVFALIASVAQALPALGDSVIRAPALGSEIVITTTSRLAGAIHSLTWGGKEFIDSADHGRQLQSASNLDVGGILHAECFNPTEAGSRRDGAGPTSSSRLLRLKAEGNRLETETQMAFWLAPGEESGGHRALNTTILSNHLLRKVVRIGVPELGLPGVLDYQVTFTLPEGEHHTQAVFEALTGYMPPDFSTFWKWNPGTGELEPLDDGPGEQAWPVVLATADGRYAMGVYAPPGAGPGADRVGYGRFRFVAEKVVKWNCVFRVGDNAGLKPGAYSYGMFVPIGTLDDVQDALRVLHARRGFLPTKVPEKS